MKELAQQVKVSAINGADPSTLVLELKEEFAGKPTPDQVADQARLSFFNQEKK